VHAHAYLLVCSRAQSAPLVSTVPAARPPARAPGRRFAVGT